jgi:hypothetical protein
MNHEDDVVLPPAKNEDKGVRNSTKLLIGVFALACMGFCCFSGLIIVSYAIQSKSSLSDGAGLNIPDFIDFIDNTDKYTGRTLTLKMTISSSIHPPDNLRKWTGRSVKFYGYQVTGRGLTRLDLSIFIPRKLNVPKLRYADDCVVRFKCGSGKLSRGNTAISITR